MKDVAGEITFLGELRRLDVKPGDRFVIMTDQRLTVEHYRKLQELWSGFIGSDGNKLLVLDGGMKIGAIGPASNNDLLAANKEVLGMLEEHGGSIVPYLLDSDMNAGQRLRDAIAAVEAQP